MRMQDSVINNVSEKLSRLNSTSLRFNNFTFDLPHKVVIRKNLCRDRNPYLASYQPIYLSARDSSENHPSVAFCLIAAT